MNYIPHCPQNIEHHCVRASLTLASAPTICPTKLDELTHLLARDLPDYTNRAIQRRRKLSDPLFSKIITVGTPEFQPIELVSHEYPPQFPQSAPQQVFLTTLERQYTGNRSTDIQQFHWLFMAQTRVGWRLVNIYSRTGGERGTSAPMTPPIESSKTLIGEGVRTWLNDCYLGKVRS